MEADSVRAKWKISNAEKDTLSSRAPIPSTTQLPPRRALCQAARMVAARPTHSKEWSTPRPPVKDRIALGSVLSDSRKSVAPAARARPSFSGERSAAMIGSAPANRAPATVDKPMPPSPSTVTESPSCTRAALRTAPTPVSTAQPISAASANGSCCGSVISAASLTTTCSASAPTPSVTFAGVPSASVPRGRDATPSAVTHSHGSPRRQNQHSRQGGDQLTTTWSPTATRLTSGPIVVTTPAASCPRITGNSGVTVPLICERSEWQTPAARTATCTFPGPGSGNSTSSTARSPPAARATNAFTMTSAPPQLLLDRLGLHELVEAVVPEFASDAGLFVSAGRCQRVERATVDVDRAGLQSAGHRQGAVLVAGPHRTGQPVAGVVGDRHRLLVVGVGDDREHRAKDLFLGDHVVGFDIGEHGGRDEVPWGRHLLAATDQSGALGQTGLDVVEHRGALARRGQGPEAGAGLHGVAGLVLLRGGGDQFECLLVSAFGHEHPGPGDAGLAGVEECVADANFHRCGEVGVVENHVGGLAAQLQGDLLDGVCCQDRDLLGNLGGAGEGHHVHLG